MIQAITQGTKTHETLMTVINAIYDYLKQHNIPSVIVISYFDPFIRIAGKNGKKPNSLDIERDNQTISLNIYHGGYLTNDYVTTHKWNLANPNLLQELVTIIKKYY